MAGARRAGLMTLVSDFEPRLPWLLYKFIQAIAHGQVMRASGRHLNQLERE